MDEAEFSVEVGAALAGKPGYTLRESLTLRPAIDVNSMWGGYTGIGAKTVIAREARAKLTMRLVAEQDPQEACALVHAHLAARCPQGVELDFDVRGAGSAASNLPCHTRWCRREAWCWIGCWDASRCPYA